MDIDERLQTVEEEKLTVPIEVLLKNIDFLPKLSIEQTEKLLTSLPYKMEEIESKIVALEMIFDEAQSRCKRVESHYKLLSISKKQSKELLSEGDRTAWVNCQEEVQKAQDDVLKAKKALKEEQTLFNRLERNFIAVRKIASLVNLTNTVIDESQKYV